MLDAPQGFYLMATNNSCAIAAGRELCYFSKYIPIVVATKWLELDTSLCWHSPSVLLPR